MDEATTLDQPSTSDVTSRQVGYIKVHGVPGVLFSDCAEITATAEAPGGRGGDNGDPLEGKSEGEAEESLLIRLPYAGSRLVIRLFFYPHEPWMPPEMTFNDLHFSSSITLKDLQDQVPCLNEWSLTADDILAQLVHQLLQLYRRYQLDRLEEDEILQIQYQSLLKALEIGEGDIEISVRAPEQPCSPSLVVRLPLSMQDVPPVLINANLGNPTTFLQVHFPKREGAFVPKLHLSPRVEALIGGAASLALPAVLPGICLRDYVERLMELLEEKVTKTIHDFEMRKQFIAELLTQFGCAVVEYDAELFNKIVLMFEVMDFHFLALITCGPLFPEQKPRVQLQSLYHNAAQEPASKELPDLQHSPQWTPGERVQQIREGIFANVSAFQTSSISSSSR